MKMLSTRTDDEMFYALKALGEMTGTDISTIMRLAIASLIDKARTKQPQSWEELKMIADQE
jgi:predicted transcriptional regulator